MQFEASRSGLLMLQRAQSRSLASSSDGGRTPDASIFDIGALALPSDQVPYQAFSVRPQSLDLHLDCLLLSSVCMDLLLGVLQCNMQPCCHVL